MHKQALTQHPRGENAKHYVQRCSRAQSSVLTQTAHPQMQTEKHLFVQGELVFSNLWDGAVGSATASWHGSSELSLPPRHLQSATSHCPFHAPHPIPYAIFPSSAASWYLSPTCVFGSTLPMALSLASLCNILYLMYKIHLPSPPLFFSCPILPCMVVSTMLFPLNPT